MEGPGWMTYCFIHTGPALSVPSFNAAVNLRTGIENIVEVLLVGNRSR